MQAGVRACSHWEPQMDSDSAEVRGVASGEALHVDSSREVVVEEVSICSEMLPIADYFSFCFYKIIQT